MMTMMRADDMIVTHDVAYLALLTLLCLLCFACFALRIEFGPLCVFILGPFYFILDPFCYRVASFWDGKPSQNGSLEGSWYPTALGGAGDGKGNGKESKRKPK